VPALNIGLARSESDVAVIVRPHVIVSEGWLEALLEAAATPEAGIVSPLLRGAGESRILPPERGYRKMETLSLSFATLLLQGAMHRVLGGFDEEFDGGEWCLLDYARRAEAAGYHTLVSSRPELECGQEIVFGSQERRKEMVRSSKASYSNRWGVPRHYGVYFGRETAVGDLAGTMEMIVAAARRGHRFTLFLHRKQYRDFRLLGWNGLHTGVELRGLSMFGSGRDLARQYARLKAEQPDLIPVTGHEGIRFPGIDTTICFSDIAASLVNGSVSLLSAHSVEVV
jgi:hypothetical protein